MEDKDALCREDLLRMQKSASITSQAGRTTMRHECLYLWIVGIQVASCSSSALSRWKGSC